ncbi:tyrosine-type recombinase/integrase [Mesobacillus jeotgali]|uniref:Tyrosine-type recombinase/integrase n=1 Tax=Mesobacillus jeotgali TaxID=129985 RepID=A0ABY9VBQ6_9BACI|nr:tyrosine-type recombinase/integrase [Mesobacillus jeotgali]WNF21327.1 tyrosine-type recombinase/integrase [Mesobacillus jeotgali]
MKGSLRKRGKKWYIIVDIGTDNGKRKQKWINTNCEKKSDAEKVLRDTLLKIDNNIFISPIKLTFTSFITDWLNNVIVNQVEETTWESYELVVTKHLIPYFEKSFKNLALQELKPIHIQKYYEYKSNPESGGLSPNTLRKHHANLKSSLDFAVRMGLLSSNPADRVVLPKKEKYRAKYYTVDQLEKLFEVCVGTPIESAVYIAAHYGLRRGEVLGLKWDAIDFKGKTITIKETRVKFGKKVVTKKPKSESSYRTLPLIRKIEEYLKLLKKKQKKSKLLFGKEYNDGGYICCWDEGTPLKTDYLNHKFKKIIRENNLEEIRFHDLRHSTASYLLKNGMSLKEIQVWLGHSDLNTTANIYAHTDMEMKKQTAKKIDGIFSKDL